jgi:hypothetical protein
VNYAFNETTIALDEMIDRAGFDDERSDAEALPLSGRVQFSGAGVLSGKAEDGTIRGMDVQSWPVTRPVLGPRGKQERQRQPPKATIPSR